jgi:hypothetical protein
MVICFIRNDRGKTKDEISGRSVKNTAKNPQKKIYQKDLPANRVKKIKSF